MREQCREKQRLLQLRALELLCELQTLLLLLLELLLEVLNLREVSQGETPTFSSRMAFSLTYCSMLCYRLSN